MRIELGKEQEHGVSFTLAAAAAAAEHRIKSYPPMYSHPSHQMLLFEVAVFLWWIQREILPEGGLVVVID